MACLSCFQSREDGAQYCRNCGENVITGEDPKHTVNLLMALLAIELLVGIGWLVVQKVIAPLLFGNGLGDIDWVGVGPLFNIFGWITDIAVTITALVCILLVKNSRARILFILYLMVRIVFVFAYRVFDHI